MTGKQSSIAAGTPEELETLLEDALVLRDRAALVDLFEPAAVLVAGNGGPVRDGAAIASRALATWHGEHTFVAAPLQVLQAGELGVVVSEQSISVARRGRDGAWRYVLVYWPQTSERKPQ